MPEDYDCIGVGIDLSAGVSEKNDYTVFTLEASKTERYLIDQVRNRTMGNLDKMDSLCDMLASWNILTENEDGVFPTMSACVIWPEAVAYQTSFEGDFKRLFMNSVNCLISPAHRSKVSKVTSWPGCGCIRSL